MDTFSNELTVMANTIVEAEGLKKVTRQDNSEVKRVELHMHTQMSQMDAMTSAKDLIKRAMKWGMKSIAITDHGVVQAFPEAHKLLGYDNPDMKIIYGVEAYLAPDKNPVVANGKGQSIDTTYCVLDLETTGFSATTEKITEVGIMKLKDGEVIDEFSCFVNPEKHIVGGCCGTTDMHIRKLAEAVVPAEGLALSPHPAQPSDNEGVAKGGLLGSNMPSFCVQKVAFHNAKGDLSENHGHDHAAEPCECCAPKAANEPSAADEIFDAILQGNADKAAEATQKAVDAGMAPQDIINSQMIRAMGEVGQRFQDGKAFVPQLLMAGKADVTIGRVVIGTVKGDLHDIGKNLVASMLEGSGFEVINIGIDVPSDKFVEALKDNHADILCMSALLTTTMTYMKDVIKAVEDAGLRDKVKIMVGGAPVSQAFADEIGADGYSDNANEAVKVARELVKGKE